MSWLALVLLPLVAVGGSPGTPTVDPVSGLFECCTRDVQWGLVALMVAVGAAIVALAHVPAIEVLVQPSGLLTWRGGLFPRRTVDVGDLSRITVHDYWLHGWATLAFVGGQRVLIQVPMHGLHELVHVARERGHPIQTRGF